MKTDEEEVAELRAMGIAHREARKAAEREKHARLEAGWNPTVHRSVPPALRGLKVSTKEPWATDDLEYQRRTGSFEPELNSQDPYFDE